MNNNANYIDQLKELPSSRGFRLLAAGLLIAVIYPQARLLWFGIITLAYFWPFVEGAFHAWEKESVKAGWNFANARMPFLPFVVLAFVIVFGLFAVAQYDLYKTRVAFDAFRKDKLDDAFSLERDVYYRGESIGLRGPVVVDVKFADGKIDEIKVVRHSDSVSVGRQAMIKMADKMKKANSAGGNIGDVDAISGATYSSLALREAVIDALWKEKGQRKISAISKTIFWFFGNDISRFVFSASAVIFIIGLLFEFCLGPFIRRDAGVTLPCYNCQTCVGVCPVKMVEDVPYPMTMILETRVGNYERAAQLAHYCVGCSRCASRCPVGLSGAMVASKAIKLAKEDKEKNKEVAGD